MDRRRNASLRGGRSILWPLTANAGFAPWALVCLSCCCRPCSGALHEFYPVGADWESAFFPAMRHFLEPYDVYYFTSPPWVLALFAPCIARSEVEQCHQHVPEHPGAGGADLAFQRRPLRFHPHLHLPHLPETGARQQRGLDTHSGTSHSARMGHTAAGSQTAGSGRSQR